MSTGENIRKERRRKKMTQKELAEKTGIAEITIRQYEKDKFKPSFEKIIRIADALEVKPLDLLTSEDAERYAKRASLFAGGDTWYHTLIASHLMEPKDGDATWRKDEPVTFADITDHLAAVMKYFHIKSLTGGCFKFDESEPGSDILTLFLKDYEKFSSLKEKGAISKEDFSDLFTIRRSRLKISLNDEKAIGKYMELEQPRIKEMKDNNTW